MDEEGHKYYRIDDEGRYIFRDPLVFPKTFVVVFIIAFAGCLILFSRVDQYGDGHYDVVASLTVAAIVALGAACWFKGYCIIVSDTEVIVKQRFSVDEYDLCDYLRLDNGTIVFADKSLSTVSTHFWFMSSAKEDALRSVIRMKRALLPAGSKRGQRSLYKDDPVDIVIHEVRMWYVPLLGLPTILLLFTVFGCFIVTEWTANDVIMIILIMLFLAVIEIVGIAAIIRVSARVKRHEIEYGYGRIVKMDIGMRTAKIFTNTGRNIRISWGRRGYHNFERNDTGIYFNNGFGYHFVALGKWERKK